MAVSTDRFRELFGSFPAVVSVITAMDASRRPRGFTCTALSAVSAEPPLLLFCVDKRSKTLDALRFAQAFMVNILSEGAREVSQLFAGRSDSKLAQVNWFPSPVAAGAPALVDVVLAHVACTVVKMVEAGDHWVVIGHIESAETFPRRPLLYQQGTYDVWSRPGALSPVG